MRLVGAAAATLIGALAVSLHGQQPASPKPPGEGAAYFIRGLNDPRDRQEARADILDTPVLPGSIVKTVALVAALEKGVITSSTTHMCRRVVKADGQTYTC